MATSDKYMPHPMCIHGLKYILKIINTFFPGAALLGKNIGKRAAAPLYRGSLFPSLFFITTQLNAASKLKRGQNTTVTLSRPNVMSWA